METIAVNGECHVIQITDKITTGSPHFVEMGHTQPSQLNYDTKRRISEAAKLANQAIGITNGPSHTEIIVTEEGPKIVEIGARLGGDCITTHLVPLSTGVDMVTCCIRIALGEEPKTEIKFSKGAAIRYLSCGAGKIESITGIETAEALEGIRQISIVHNIGDTVSEIKSSSDRVGFVVAQGDTPTDAADQCNRAMKMINITTKDVCI